MDFATSVRTCLHKYADFNGRASRSEFWWFYLFTALVTAVVYIVPFTISIVGSLVRNTSASIALAILGFGANLLVFGVVIALVIPLLAVGCRRLHDYGQSGWLQALMAVPCGSIALIVLWVQPGTPGPNAFGPPVNARGADAGMARPIAEQ